ncbi:endosialidase [Lachnospiraceae bacterium MD1]|uniref:Endosialidase n=1 Tax=Variimorphobacter saccharofermentans TaxID=2755051 RepID=A0A839K2K9_9FIRM|nr:endosialidase [Variimorphobacter saccharofermentans]MBB2184145.1 endosialidase [Variimorphobacter saccharofermentans]
MAVVEELIRKESNGTISFGNYKLSSKSKVSDFEYQGDLYKVKTFQEITKLEKNGMFVYESVPGTTVFHLDSKDDVLSFEVTGNDTAQITLELEPEKEYEIYNNDDLLGRMKTNLGGKLVFSLELGEDTKEKIKVVKL